MRTVNNKNLYLVLTGAKKCSLMPQLIGEFVSDGANVYTFLTDMARGIVNFDELKMDNNHISLDYSPKGNELPLEDLVLIAPCTFNTLNKIAGGIADSYPLTIVAGAIGKRKKVLIAPAMNKELWEHPITRCSLSRLEHDFDCRIIWPEITPNKVTMAPIEKIADTVYNFFTKIRYESKRLEPDEQYSTQVKENFAEFKFVGRSLLEADVIKGSAGFLSKRVKGGFLVTATGSNVGTLREEDISLVLDSSNGSVYWRGFKHPSSETPLLIELYEKFPASGAIIHTHSCSKLTYNPKMQGYVSPQYVRYGRYGEYKKILGVLSDNEGFAIMKLHGEICLSNSLSEGLDKIKRRLEDAR